MHVLVDLNRYQSYGQYVYAAPEVFSRPYEEVLEWTYAVVEDQHDAVQGRARLSGASHHRERGEDGRMNGAESVRRVVVVGASLAGLSAAQELRRLGFAGSLTVVGDEPYLPYDRTPLTKGVLTGRLAPDATPLHVAADLDATWLLGWAATALDPGGAGGRMGRRPSSTSRRGTDLHRHAGPALAEA